MQSQLAKVYPSALLKICLMDRLSYYFVLDTDAIARYYAVSDRKSPKYYYYFLQYSLYVLRFIMRNPLQFKSWNISPPVGEKDVASVTQKTVKLIQQDFESLIPKLSADKDELQLDEQGQFFLRKQEEKISNIDQYLSDIKWMKRHQLNDWLNLLIVFLLNRYEQSMFMAPDTILFFRKIYMQIDREHFIVFLMYFYAVFKQIFLFKYEHQYWDIHPCPSSVTKSRVILSDTTVKLLYLNFVDNVENVKMDNGDLMIKADAILWVAQHPDSFRKDQTFFGREKYLRARSKKMSSF